jgi:hypothetical protein
MQTGIHTYVQQSLIHLFDCVVVVDGGGGGQGFASDIEYLMKISDANTMTRIDDITLADTTSNEQQRTRQ